MLSPYKSPVERAWFWTHRGLCALVLLFLILPVLVIIPLSFNSGSFLVYPLQGFSLRWYEDFFTSAEWMRSLKNSLIVAPAATVLAMVFGTLASIGLTRGEFRGKALVMSLLISPMVAPVVIVGVASYLFFAPMGLGNSYTSLILVHAVLGVPLLNVANGYNFIDSLLFGAGSAVGFSLVLILFAGIRERIEGADVPVHFRGVAIAMVTAGLMALAFMGFAGLDKYQ